MVRRFVMAAVLSSACAVAFAPAASAQSYGGITLSFGSGGYGAYDGDAYQGYSGYDDGSYDPYQQERREAWIARQRYEQHELWEQQERARQEYREHEREEHRDWHRDDDDD